MITEKVLSHIQEGYAIQEGFESHEHAMNSLSQCRNPVLLSEYINGMLSVKKASEMSEWSPNLERIADRLENLNKELYRICGTDSYPIRCDIHDLISELRNTPTNKQLKIMKTYIVDYHYQKRGFQMEIEASSIQEAQKMAKDYERKDNIGECKSDRIRLKSVKLK